MPVPRTVLVAALLATVPTAAAAAPWSPPAQVSGTGTIFPAGLPLLAVAPDGTAALAWQRGRPGRYSVEIAQRYSPGAPFDEPVEVDFGSRAFVGPAVASAPSARAMVVWARRGAGGDTPRALALGVAAVPSFPTVFPAVTGVSRVHAGIAAGRHRALWEVFGSRIGTDSGPFESSQRTPPGDWTPPSGIATEASVTAFAEAPDGSSATAWVTAGSLWVAAGTAAPADLGPVSGAPAVAVARGGRALAAWCGAGLMVAEWDGGAWSAPRELGTALSLPACALPPAVAVDAAGAAVVAWRAPRDGRLQLLAAHRSAARGWTGARVLGRATRNVGAPVAVIGRRGGALVAWTHPVSASGSLIASRPADARGVWGPRSDVGVTGFRAVGPDLGVDAAGRVTASWLAVPNGPYTRGLRVMTSRRLAVLP